MISTGEGEWKGGCAVGVPEFVTLSVDTYLPLCLELKIEGDCVAPLSPRLLVTPRPRPPCKD